MFGTIFVISVCDPTTKANISSYMEALVFQHTFEHVQEYQHIIDTSRGVCFTHPLLHPIQSSSIAYIPAYILYSVVNWAV